MSTYRTQNLDANEGVFYARELEHIKARTYDKKYPALTYRELIPISMEGGEGITSITYESYDRVGMAKLINAYAADLPRPDRKRPGTGEGLCMNSKADHYGHLLQSWHPVPWVAIMDADTSEIIPGAECFMDEGDECDCDDCDCGPGKDC